jgi:protocatechuate 3,4-dioxygenase beta subunit
VFGRDRVSDTDADLTIGPDGQAVGQRIIVTGRLLDGGGRPIRGSLVEIWQANASGRYRHRADRWPGALDPNFTGAGRALTDEDGTYRFTTVKPGAYPWGNHANAWRPAHIHFSVYGWAFAQRLVTQMYFPDDPLFSQDPIFNSIPDPVVRRRLVARYDHELSEEQWALGFRFDIVVRGPAATPFEEPDRG